MNKNTHQLTHKCGTIRERSPMSYTTLRDFIGHHKEERTQFIQFSKPTCNLSSLNSTSGETNSTYFSFRFSLFRLQSRVLSKSFFISGFSFPSVFNLVSCWQDIFFTLSLSPWHLIYHADDNPATILRIFHISTDSFPKNIQN